MFGSLKHLLCLYLVSLQVLHNLHMPLVKCKYHTLVSVLDLAEALQYLNYDIGDVLVVLEGKAYNLLCAHHIKLVDAPLAHLALQIVCERLLSLRAIFITMLLAD